jgi:DNA-binding transcriptional regulator YiaG
MMHTSEWLRTGGDFPKKTLVGVCAPLLFLIGTGGDSAGASVLQQYLAQDFTTYATPASHTKTLTGEATSTAQSLAERVSEIKAAFGLSISQLAQVLQVQRQTIYDWMDEEAPRQVQGQNRERLTAIQKLATQWNVLCRWPAGKGIATYEVEGSNLLALLADDVLDNKRINKAMRDLSEHVTAEWQRWEERSVGEQARRRGFQPPSQQSLRNALAGYGGTVSLTHDE